MQMHIFKKALLPLMATAAIVGCSNDNKSLGDTQPADGLAVAVFQPSEGVLPFPSDLLFAGTPDGSINIPLTDKEGNALFNYNKTAAPTAAELTAAGSNMPRVAMNTMDGFSTTAMITFTASVAVDTSTLQAGVHIYTPNAAVNIPAQGVVGGVQLSSKTIVAVGDKLTYGVDYVVSSSDSKTIGILPLKPLSPSSTYYVAVTSDLKTTKGLPVGSDVEYAIAKSTSKLITKADGTACDFSTPATCTAIQTSLLTDVATAISFEQVRLQTNAHETAAVTFDATAAVGKKINLTRDKIALGFSFSTQNIGGALINAKGQVAATSPSIDIHNEYSEWGLVTTGGATANGLELVSPGTDGVISTSADASANVFLGTLNNIAQFVDPADKNGSFWKGSTAAWAQPTVVGPTASASCLAGFPGLALGAGSENLAQCNGFTPALVNATHDIPVIVSVPNATTIAAVPGCAAKAGTFPTTPGTGLPILIYQHGITTHRGTIMAIADAMAKACVAVVAIDLPKHGILPTNDPFGASDLTTLYQTVQAADGITTVTPERLVQMPAASGCQTQASPAPDFNPGPQEIGSTGVFACPSADRYINLENLANARDTFRQGVVDLHSLYKVVSAYVAGTTTFAEYGVSLDGGNVHFLGMSLGGITGMPFVAQESGLKTVMLNVASGGISKVVDGSASFEPAVVAGLAAAGVTKPSALYETFLIATQTMLDSADPMNMTGQIGKAEDAATFWAGVTASAGTARPVLFQEVVGAAGATAGDGTCNASLDDGVDNSGCPDLSVPNNTFMSSSLATAWGAVSGSGQTGALPGQNAVTVPAALSGTDVLTQGTAFVALATAGLLGDPLAATGAATFSGMALPEVGKAGAVNAGAEGQSGLVRLTAGEHGSLLAPSINLLATTVMQTQAAVYVSTGGKVIAGSSDHSAYLGLTLGSVTTLTAEVAAVIRNK
jgi:hypothetical protein